MIATFKNSCTISIVFGAVFTFSACSKKIVNAPVEAQMDSNAVATTKTFINPLLAGSDPWVIKKDSFYYYTQTLGNSVAIWKTKRMSTLGSAASTTVFLARSNTANSSNIWAPELHFINDKWYIYYTAGSGPDSTQRIWVLENGYADPTNGTWIDKGKLANSDAGFWAIDASVFSYKGINYLVWSGRPDLSVQNQNIYIAKMTNPWTLATPTVMLTKPELAWEINGGPVNEGPEILQNAAGQIFLIYSASGCWTDEYGLGMLSLKDGTDPMVITSWNKSLQPVFSKAPQNNSFGPGHNAFFKSVDGTEDWIIYHANTNRGEGCGAARNIRIQKFSWNADGSPNFGIPGKINLPVAVPSGE